MLETKRNSLRSFEKKVEKEIHNGGPMQIKNLVFEYDSNPERIFDKANFSIQPGEKVALVGPNGSGKSTLQHLLARHEGFKPLSGEVHNGGHEVLYLEQEITEKESVSVKDWLFARLGLAGIQNRMKELENSQDVGEEWQKLFDRFEHLGGYNFERNLETALQNVPLVDFSVEKDINALSEGQQQRFKLLLLALAQHDIVLMDEPTNGLDRDGIIWLKDWLRKTNSGVMLVSHDRDLLSTAGGVNRIAAIDTATRGILKANSNYTEFREQALARREQLGRDKKAQQRYIKSLQQKLANKRQAAMMGSKIVSDSDKIGTKFRAEKASGKAGAAVRKIEQELSRIVEIEFPEKTIINFDIETDVRKGNALTFANLQIERDKQKFGPWSGAIEFGDRVVIEGPNGSGKTTLLEMISDQLMPESGSVRKALDIKTFYLRQQRKIQEGHSTWEYANSLIKQQGLNFSEGEIKSRLVNYGLSEVKWARDISSLSPGERTRLQASIISLVKPGLLILDEPTNQLDVDVIEALEQGLQNYKGALVVVSHDKAFIDNIKPTKTWEINPKRELKENS